MFLKRPTFLLMIISVSMPIFAGGFAPGAQVREKSLILGNDSESGKPVDLASPEFKGNIIVLEWTNPGCPYVQKYYESGAMQALQKKWTGRGVTWLTINSTRSDHPDAKDVKKYTSIDSRSRGLDKKSHATRLIIDEKGIGGLAFAVKTTPHMFVIDRKGLLAYQGAIDDRPTTDPKDLPSADSPNKGARPLVDEVLLSLEKGKVVAKSTTPYGCGVKYAP